MQCFGMHLLTSLLVSTQHLKTAVWLYLGLSLLISSCRAAHVLHSFTGTIGAGNFSYYKLNRPGRVTLLLESLEGDADIYVSESTLTPTFDLDKYDLQSASCGEDKVEVPKLFRRPVGVGIYGHISRKESKYRLSVVLEDELAEEYQSYSMPQHSFHGGNPAGKDEEESIIWTIFISILKIIFDILV